MSTLKKGVHGFVSRCYVLLALGVCLFVITVYGKQQTYEIDQAKTIYTLAVDLYREVGNEPELTARLVAHVVTNRAQKNRSYWGGSEIIGVIFARAEAHGKIVCQNSWTCSEHKRDKLDWSLGERERAVRIATDELKGSFPLPAQFSDADHYLNEKLSKRENVCWFKTHLVKLGKAEPRAQTTFYREPKDKTEQSFLPKHSQVPECKTATQQMRPHSHRRAANAS